ncbi:MAG: YchJ family protein [Ghiorsea sp.]
MATENTGDCPCDSGKTLDHCCKPYHDGTMAAPTAEALMRSRYTAFVLNLPDYIWKTWHESTRPELEILGGLGLKWINLNILSTEAGSATDTQGKVHFIASFVQGKKGKKLDETSDFIKLDDSWVYIDGESSTSDISRNEPCPCGSGIKFKRCCLR